MKSSGRGAWLRRGIAASSVLLVPAAVAIAVKPSEGRWTGSTSRPARVTFRVLSDRSAMRHLHVGKNKTGVRLHCSKTQGDYIDAEFVARKGIADAIPVDSDGHFAARYQTSGNLSKGRMKVRGRVKSKHRAAGTLNWKVTERSDGRTCKSGNVHFTAKSP